MWVRLKEHPISKGTSSLQKSSSFNKIFSCSRDSKHAMMEDEKEAGEMKIVNRRAGDNSPRPSPTCPLSEAATLAAPWRWKGLAHSQRYTRTHTNGAEEENLFDSSRRDDANEVNFSTWIVSGWHLFNFRVLINLSPLLPSNQWGQSDWIKTRKYFDLWKLRYWERES